MRRARLPSRCARCTAARSSKSTPIIPVPTAQLQRLAVSAVGRMPASRIASSAATSAKRCERLANLRSLRSPTASSRRPFTSAAMRTGNPLASNTVIGAPPLRPARSASHVAATSLPTGVTRPMPVIATRRRILISRFRRCGPISTRDVAIIFPSARADSDATARVASGGCELGPDFEHLPRRREGSAP